MSSVVQTGEYRHASWWQLSLVFLLALLLFVVLRWQPEPWLRSQMVSQSQQQGIELDLNSLNVDAFSVHIDGASIKAAAMPTPLIFETLTLEPAWFSLLTGTVAVRLIASWQGQKGQAVLALQENRLDISDIHAAVDAAVLQSIWQGAMAIPLNVSGQVQISGRLSLMAETGHPVKGQLTTLWQAAAIELAGTTMSLGDYQLMLQSAEGAADSWPWTLTGGTAVLLNSKGVLHTAGNVLQEWVMSGLAEAEAGEQAAGLASMLGTAPMKFRLSGSVIQPRLERL